MKSKLFLLALPVALALGALASAQSAQTYCKSTVNSTTRAAQIGYTGNLSIRLNDTCLDVQNVPRGSLGLFFYGKDRTQVRLFDGFLCVGSSANVYRMAPVLADGSCSAHCNLDLWYGPESKIIKAGETWYFQYLFWDHAAGSRNLSNGLAVTFAP